MPEDPMSEGGPVEPGMPGKQIAESAEENVEALPGAPGELMTREGVVDPPVAPASVPVAAPMLVVAATEPEPSNPAATAP